MMSAEHVSTNGGGAQHQKSFKRKYRKLRHKFKDVMKQSDELFKQEQLANAAIRRLQEENTRILDLLVDLNSSQRIPKDRRHNIGSPSRPTPPRFLSPTLLATIGDPSILDSNGDVEDMELGDETSTAVPNTNGRNPNSSSDDDNNSSDDDTEDEKTPAPGRDSRYSSGDEEDDNEAYLEEMREWNYRRGIAGTPPRYIREKMKADAEQERKDAEEQAKKAAVEAAAEKRNGVASSTVPNIKHEDSTEGSASNGLEEAAPKPPITEDYRRGQTPDYLKDPSPFLMTLEEEDEWYNEIHRKYDDHIPPLQHPSSPSAGKAESDPRNPMSVYCWLRKNQPQVFLQGEEGEKKPGGRGRGGGRRKPVEADSGDELAGKTAGKRRRTNGEEMEDSPGVPRSAGRAGRGGGGLGGVKRKAGGEPPLKRQRR